MRMPLTTRRSPRQPAPAGPLHAGRIARALVLLFLLLQALPLAHALLQQFDPLLGDICVAVDADEGGSPSGSEHHGGCGTCCCGGASPLPGNDPARALCPAVQPLAQRSVPYSPSTGADFARPWSRAPPRSS